MLMVIVLSVVSLMVANCSPEFHVVVLISILSSVHLHYDDCSHNQDICGFQAVCENLSGSFLCQCQDGFYRDGESCRACSMWCPAGFYESIPCSASKDRICSSCTVCSRHEFEARPCQPLHNTLCLHVAYPLLMFGEKEFTSFLQGFMKTLPANRRRKRLRIDASKNIFLENLHSTRHMETMYYITDMKQLTDFFWFRDSGIRINIGLQNINLIPIYEDVDHDGDNEFIMGRPEMEEEKKPFANIMKNHCRNPIPDYYSMTLEISRDRTTQAWLDTCTPDKHRKGICPDSAYIGDQFLHRTLNEPCEKMGTYPTPLEVATNSIACTEANNSLLKLFNITSVKMHPITFPSKECKNFYSRCDKCLQTDQCQVNDLFEQRCCQLDCYLLFECKQSAAKKCDNLQVECASGDAYRYTLQPIFKNLKQEFHCHLKLSKPLVLYQVWFYVSITSVGFETPRVFHQVNFDGINNFTSGHYNMEFLTIEHSTGVEFQNELILTGRRSGDVWNHFVSLVSEKNSTRQGEVAQFSSKFFTSNLQLINLQFDLPFAYSTSSWVGEKNHCAKDINKFKPVDWKFRNWSQAMNVITQTGRAPYTYVLKSIDNPPHMKFIIPANISVIRWWFHGRNASLIMNDQFHSHLSLSADERVWEVQLSGRLRDCPGYLGITINDRLEMEEVFKYDALISCPPEFNLTFNIPNWGVKVEKTFDVILDDATRRHHIFLTNLLFDDTAATCKKSIHLQYKNEDHNDISSEDMLLVIFVTSLLLVLLIYFCLRLCTELCRKSISDQLNSDRAWSQQAEVIQSHYSLTVSKCVQRFRRLNKVQKTVVLFYIICQLIYCVLMTFTVISIMWSLSIHEHVESFSSIRNVQLKFRELTNTTLTSLDLHVIEELKRQASVLDNMQNTCNTYTDDLAKLLCINLDQMFGLENLTNFLVGDESRTERVLRDFNITISRFVQDVGAFVHQYQLKNEQSIWPVISHYKAYIQNVMRNSWLMYPNSIFNKTKWWLSALDGEAMHSNIHHSGHRLLRDEIALASFLNLHEVEAVSFWLSNFVQRLNEELQVFISSVSFQRPECCICDSEMLEKRPRYNFGNSTVYLKMDSSKYFMSDLFRRTSSMWLKDMLIKQHEVHYVNTLPVAGFTDFEESKAVEYGFIEASSNTSRTDLDSVWTECRETPELDIISWRLLKFIFFSLDIIILVFRFSHICLNVQKMCYGFEEMLALNLVDAEHTFNTSASIPVKSEFSPPTTDHWQNYCSPSDSVHELSELNSCVASCKEPSVTASPTTLPNHIYAHHRTSHNKVSTLFPSAKRMCNFTYLSNPMLKRTAVSHNLRKTYFKKFLKRFWQGLSHSETIPSLILMVMVLFIVSLGLKLAQQLLQPTLILNLSGYFPMTQILGIHINATNGYLIAMADMYSTDMPRHYTKHMVQELSFLQWIAEVYLSGVSKEKQSSNVNLGEANSTHEFKQRSMEWYIPMLPCNSVPIQSKVYPGCRQATLWQELQNEFSKIFRSTFLLLVALCRVLVISFSVIIVANTAEKLLFHFMQIRQHCPRRYLYVTATSWQTYSTSSPNTRTATNSDIVVSILPGQTTAKTIQTVYSEPGEVESTVDHQPASLKSEFTMALFSETKV